MVVDGPPGVPASFAPRPRHRPARDGAIPATGGVPVAPGDLVRLPGGRRRRVLTTFACRLPDGGPRWWWSFLDDGTILEQAGTGDWLYVTHDALPDGANATRELVGPNGYLEDFEAQVRAGGDGAPVVVVPFGGRAWHVAATGVVVAERAGEVPPLPGWSSLGSVPDGPPDVWFALEDRSRPGHAVLGIWTDRVALATGRRLVSRPRAAPVDRAGARLAVDARRDHDGDGDDERARHDRGGDVAIIEDPLAEVPRGQGVERAVPGEQQGEAEDREDGRKQHVEEQLRQVKRHRSAPLAATSSEASPPSAV